ncbi:choline/ethanolamine kinase family protein [Mycolicibacterium hodleri]|uniref:LPS biosynthesis choline kinase n=1 Tax=Mycolicibacterium hodleri TaxID=49897 RepID=A0A502E840_9MYCO|nr:choline/ethanolamine kinase family protein [Mycolicibacterium hodleri]TPG33627.1 LPS biosynthesis choline kinase [Mycolicibacterium hodleri]
MSASLNDSHLNELFDQLPVLAGRERRLEDLDGGLTNRNVKITTSDAVYVARCSGSSSSLLAIDRDNEHYNSRAAERAGVGAPVIDYRPDLGILLIGYLDGITLSKDDFSRPGVIAKAAHACRTLHGGPRFRDDFDMFALQSSYLKIARQNGFRIPDDYSDFADQFESIRRALEPDSQRTVPCNNDLLAANFVEDGDKIWLIDYEYSGNNDPCFELGNIWRDNRLTLEQLEELVTEYYGRPTRHELARARLQGTVSQYGWTLWGCIQNGGSALDFDFWEWGMERYENAVEEFRGPDFGGLLDDVNASD